MSATQGEAPLAIELVLGLLIHPDRIPNERVPVRCSLAGWDPALSLQTFLVEQIHEQFRSQGITRRDAQHLVDRHQVLPVLDGLDEMDVATAPAARRRAVRALKQLNAYQAPTGSAPVILTLSCSGFRGVPDVWVCYDPGVRRTTSNASTTQVPR
ncbi:hypothetical protein [Kitasatospora sp. NBC_01539]|uniref:hypothetical protein n=1 Tax=Kitasatospora sp. NBC_01539 TaxID=2903577 RepID=UPI003860265A